MLKISRLAAVLLAAAFALPAAADQFPIPTVVGTAYDRSSGYLLYTERHFCSAEGLLCNVEYRDSFGAMIAEKKLDYSLSLIGPALVMNDYRQDLAFTVPGSEQGDMVVDAGFDNYVRHRWDELLTGNAVRFPFFVVGFDKPLKMRANREESVQCNADELCLSVGLSSWLLGKLVDPIELSYSRDSKKLLRFSGVSNIKGEGGETLSVDIHYQYDSDILLVGPLDYRGPQTFEF